MELEEAGFICKTRQGARPNKANLYALTWLPLNESPKLDMTAGAYPLHVYRKTLRLPPLKLKPDGQNIPINPRHGGNNDPSTHPVIALDGEKLPQSDPLAPSEIGKNYPPSIVANPMVGESEGVQGWQRVADSTFHADQWDSDLGEFRPPPPPAKHETRRAARQAINAAVPESWRSRGFDFEGQAL